MDGRPNRRNKAPFSNFSVVMSTPPISLSMLTHNSDISYNDKTNLISFLVQ